MSDVMNSIEIDEQYVELLPARTTMEVNLAAFLRALGLGPILDAIAQVLTGKPPK